MLPHRTLLSVPLEWAQNRFFSQQWRSNEKNRPLRFVAHRPPVMGDSKRNKTKYSWKWAASSVTWHQTQCGKTVIVPIFKIALVITDGFVFWNNSSIVFEFVIHYHTSLFKSKLNPNQRGFSKAKWTTTNFVTYLGFISLLINSHLKLILFILTLAVNLTLYRNMFYFKNFLPMGFQMVI